MGAGGLDQPLGVVGEGALIEQGGDWGKHAHEMALPACSRNLTADNLHRRGNRSSIIPAQSAAG